MRRHLVLVVLVAALGACGGPSAPGEADASSGKVATEARDTMKFEPNRFVRVKRGAAVTIELKNSGATVHSFFAPELGVSTALRVNGGRTGTVTFTAPSQPGTYRFVCSEPGHAEAGMTGEVVVQ